MDKIDKAHMALNQKNKKLKDEISKEAALAQPVKEEKVKFEFTFSKLIMIRLYCNALRSFLHTKFPNLRKLDKNYRILDKLITELIEEGKLIDERSAEIDKKSAEGVDGKELLPLREEVNRETEVFNTRKNEVFLYTMKESDFPIGEEDISKYPVKLVMLNDQQGREVNTVEALQGLLGTVIEEEEL